MKILSALLLLHCIAFGACAQNFPWERPLKMAWSSDGTTFDIPTVFQDSSGVPSVIRWKGDTLICAFQWFRLPMNSPTWDKVAVKFSYDKGLSWTAPVPIIINGLPLNYQRPFDPTLVTFAGDSLRIYYSSSEGMPQMGLDSTVNTYSAKSADGIHYEFEPLPRVDDFNNRVIDPAVIFFNNGWHYTAPIGSPQQGAYHFVSPDGINFTSVPSIPSDNLHNWTGNLMQNDSAELRFYGASPSYIWFNTSPNGGLWNGYTNTNIHGGDPSVVKTDSGSYLMIYVGEPYGATGLDELSHEGPVVCYPNPVSNYLHMEGFDANNRNTGISIYDLNGRLVKHLSVSAQSVIVDMRAFAAGSYMLKYEFAGKRYIAKISKR